VSDERGGTRREIRDSKTINIPDMAEKTITTPLPNDTPGTFDHNRDSSYLDEEDAEEEKKRKTETRRRPTRHLYGSLNVSGCPWVAVNMGLLIVSCGCGQKQEIDSKKSFEHFLELVDKFSTKHIGCGRFLCDTRTDIRLERPAKQ
jgi:hypothetical protein